MKKTITILGLAAVLLLGTFQSCKENFLDETNPNQLSLDTFFTTEADALNALNSAYASLQRSDLYKRKYFFLFDLLSDDVRGNDPLYADGQTLSAYTFNASSETVGEVWRGLYRGIQRTNFVLDNLERLKPSDLTKRIEAESKFLRALYYFDLVVNYGGVPLQTKSFSTESQGKERATPAQVWAQIEADLKAVEGVLPDTYSADNLGRATKWSAKALLGKSYLFQKKNTEAAAKLKEIVDYARANPAKIGLMADYGDNFVEVNGKGEYVEFNKESLFEVSFAGQDRTGGTGNWGEDGNGIGEGTFRGIEYGIAAFQNTSPSLALVSAYPDNDPRKRIVMFGPGDMWNDNKAIVPYPRTDWQHRKYSNKTPGASGDDFSNFQGSSINMRVIRYADVLLMYAEALNQQGTTFSADAAAAVNEVRARVKLAPITATTGAQLFQSIISERRLELSFEQCRRKDIVRWGIARNELGNKFVVGKHELLPVPQGERDLNGKLNQNPGY